MVIKCPDTYSIEIRHLSAYSNQALEPDLSSASRRLSASWYIIPSIRLVGCSDFSASLMMSSIFSMDCRLPGQGWYIISFRDCTGRWNWSTRSMMVCAWTRRRLLVRSPQPGHGWSARSSLGMGSWHSLFRHFRARRSASCNQRPI